MELFELAGLHREEVGHRVVALFHARHEPVIAVVGHDVPAHPDDLLATVVEAQRLDDAPPETDVGDPVFVQVDDESHVGHRMAELALAHDAGADDVECESDLAESASEEAG